MGVRRSCAKVTLVVGLTFAGSLNLAAQTSTRTSSASDFCGREDGRFIATCQATCQTACNEPAFASRSEKILYACRQLRSGTGQRNDAAECKQRRAEMFEPDAVFRENPISLLGQGAEQCLETIEKGENIEVRVGRLRDENLKKDVAAFWDGRPNCAPSTEALVGAFECIQGGAKEIATGYISIRQRMNVTPNQTRDQFCKVARPLIEGSTYTELGQVDERIKKFDARVHTLNGCAKAFRDWSDQRFNKSSSDSPPSPQLVDVVNVLSTQLQQNLQKFAGMQTEFSEIRDNIGTAKREITAAAVRAVNLCQ